MMSWSQPAVATAGPGGSFSGRADTGGRWQEMVGRRSTAIVALVFAVLLVATGLPAASSTPAPGVRWFSSTDGADKVEPGLATAGDDVSSVIVQAVPGRDAAARSAITAAGGEVRAELPFVHGFEAELSGEGVQAVAASDAVRSVSVNHRIKFEDYTYDESTTASNFARTAQATAAWATGNLGAGVGVAVLDTGISPMRDFDGRVVYGPDL